MSVIGIDPGAKGALAHYDAATGALDIIDMPMYNVVVNRKTRQRVNGVELIDYFEMYKMFGVRLVLIEAVNQQPKQNGMFAFGFGVGVLWMGCIATRLPMETVSSGAWKKVMKVPGKSKKATKEEIRAYEDAILHRAYDLFPDHKQLFHGPKGGKRIDRCEAALIAYYAAHFALNSVHDTKLSDIEKYNEADI